MSKINTEYTSSLLKSNRLTTIASEKAGDEEYTSSLIQSTEWGKKRYQALDKLKELTGLDLNDENINTDKFIETVKALNLTTDKEKTREIFSCLSTLAYSYLEQRGSNDEKDKEQDQKSLKKQDKIIGISSAFQELYYNNQ